MQPEKLPEKTEYAPQYTLAFRLGCMAAVVVLLWVLERIMPWLMQQPFWLCHPHGFTWLYYGLLATPPLLTGIWALGYRGRRVWQALRSGQYPPPGSKVWLAGVRYAYGAAAQRRAGGIWPPRFCCCCRSPPFRCICCICSAPRRVGPQASPIVRPNLIGRFSGSQNKTRRQYLRWVREQRAKKITRKG